MTRPQTIVALATSPMPAGVAVVRVSGSQAWEVAAAIAPKLTAQTPPRQAIYSPFVNPTGETLDMGLVLGFRAPNSFTGEDVVELHPHGSRAVIDALLKTLTAHDGVRHAQPGEFSRRAFENNKLDLVQAEAIMDMVAAETDAQRQQATRALQGQTGQWYEGLRSQLMHLCAHVEAAIDFPDEELDVLAEEPLKEKLGTLIHTLETGLHTKVGERIRDGFRVVIVGKPNAGKSTLANLLAGSDVAIVSNIAGTTRDVVETHLNVAGYPVILADTAGLRDQTEDTIEQQGITRAKQKASVADVVIAVTHAHDAHAEIFDATAMDALQRTGGVHIISHADEAPFTGGTSSLPQGALALNLNDAATATPVVLKALEEAIQGKIHGQQSAATITRQRHRTAVEEALQHLQRGLQVLTDGTAPSVAELLAADLRHAATALGHVTGRTSTEDVLDVVFGEFCLGK